MLVSLGVGITDADNIKENFEEYKERILREHEGYKQNIISEFEKFRQKVNDEYAEYMKRDWTSRPIEKAKPRPDNPEPPQPIFADPKDKEEPRDLPISEIKPIDIPHPNPIPLLPTNPIEPVEPTNSFLFFGKECIFPFDKSLKFSLTDIDEKTVSHAWKTLSSSKSVALIRKCIEYKEELNLPDWGYVLFLDKLSESLYPNKPNEQVVLKLFILTQSGYKVRIARINNKLALLIPSRQTLYDWSYVNLNGEDYYVYDREGIQRGNVKVFDQAFPKEQTFTLGFNGQPRLPVAPGDKKHFISKKNPEIQLELSVNKNLIDFYNEYPSHSNWEVYAKASLSEEVKSQLYPVLKNTISGKDEKTAVNMLLQFVQTAFDYKTDFEQFGEERAFFSDETFYYPYSDCEDRAILFSVLVRELLNLDVVFIQYTEHLATAVRFNESVSGDNVTIDGANYVVCDPTYINSRVGMSMPVYKGAEVVVIKI